MVTMTDVYDAIKRAMDKEYWIAANDIDYDKVYINNGNFYITMELNESRKTLGIFSNNNGKYIMYDLTSLEMSKFKSLSKECAEYQKKQELKYIKEALNNL